jgi:hypothetical protein
MAKIKSGGRVAGTPNRVTVEIRSALSMALAGEIESLPKTLAELEPQARVDAVIKLCKYLVPPMAAIAPQAADEQDFTPSNYIEKITPWF